MNTLYKSVLFFSLCMMAALTGLAQSNTLLTTTTSSPGGASNVLIGPGNTYPGDFSGFNNTAVGEFSGTSINTGNNNSFLGKSAGQNNTSGSDNSFLGYQSGYSNTTGAHNSFIGHSAGFHNVVGYDNAFFGYQAGFNNYGGLYNSFFGSSAGYENINGSFNSFFGYQAGQKNIGLNNTFLGSTAGQNNTIAIENTFVGANSGASNTTGGGNSFLGTYAGFSNTTGAFNAFVGYQAGTGNTSGSRNTHLGYIAGGVGTNAQSLQRATSVGYNAKVGVNDGLVLGDSSTVKVGIGTAYPTDRLTLRGNLNFVACDNSLRLKGQPLLHWDERENLALGLGSEIEPITENTLILGNTNTRVGFGTSRPETKVEINSGEKGQTGIRFTQMAGQQKSGQFLTLDDKGTMRLASPRVQVANATDWSDQVFEPGYPLLPLPEVERFVRTNGHLPNIPSAREMTETGMESTVFNARLVEKIEELTLYVVELEKRLANLENK